MGEAQAILLQVLNTAVIIGILVLIGTGMAIIFGLMSCFNMAQGEFVMLGAYSVVVANQMGLSFWVGLVIAVVLVGTLGYLIEIGVVSRLYGRPLDSILATWGVSLIIQQTVRVIFGPDPKPVIAPIEGATILVGVPFPTYKLFMLAAIIVVAVGTFLLLRYPTFGVMSRAVFEDREMAECLGIKGRSINARSFALGAALAGLAGALLAPLITIGPYIGSYYLTRAFLTVIVGGVGNLLGVAAGAGVIGGTEGTLAYWGSSLVAQVIVLAIAILALRLRPQGLLPRR